MTASADSIPSAGTSSSNLLGWTVVAFGFVAIAFSYAARALLGLVMPIWESELGWSRSLISSGGALALIVMALAAPVAGDLVDRFGPRKLLAAGLVILAAGLLSTTVSVEPWHFLISFGVVSGIGFGVVAVNAVFAAVAPYFDRNRGFVLGVVDSGSTIGQFLLVPAAALLLALFDWRLGFVAIALICLALVPLAWRGLPRQAAAVEAAQGVEPAARGRIAGLAASPAFHLLFWSFVLCGFTSSGVIETHFLPYAAFCGFAPVAAAGAFGFLSGVNLVGILLAGWLSDRMHRPLLLAIIYAARALTFVLLMNVGTDSARLYLFAGLFGLFDYATAPVVASLVASHLGLRVMGLAMGILSAGHAVGAAAGALAGGVVFDFYGGYRELWLFSVTFALLAAVIAVCLKERRPALA